MPLHRILTLMEGCHGIPHILRVLDSFFALICPGFEVAAALPPALPPHAAASRQNVGVGAAGACLSRPLQGPLGWVVGMETHRHPQMAVALL